MSLSMIFLCINTRPEMTDTSLAMVILIIRILQFIQYLFQIANNWFISHDISNSGLREFITKRTEDGQLDLDWQYNRYPNCTTDRSEFREKPENSFNFLSILVDLISIQKELEQYMKMRTPNFLLMLTTAVSFPLQMATVNIMAAGELWTGRKLGSMILTE